MEWIGTYCDIPEERRDAVLSQLFRIGFCPAYGRQKTVKREMEKSRPGSLPQYLFLFREEELIGYLFLIAEREGYSRVFPWWAVGNPDELPLESAVRLLERGTSLSLKCGAPRLAQRMKLQMEEQKKGIGRRPESLCC